MAEFSVVMKHAKRMCKTYESRCDRCPFGQSDGCPFDFFKHHMKSFDFYEVEHIVMNWADKHPEPKYPTWIEWWDENFSSKGRRMFTPCSFVPPAELGCSIGMDGCMNAPYKCWHTPIPAEIAKKLNIKPIGG